MLILDDATGPAILSQETRYCNKAQEPVSIEGYDKILAFSKSISKVEPETSQAIVEAIHVERLVSTEELQEIISGLRKG